MGVGVGVGVYEPLCVMEDDGECHLFRYGSIIFSSRPVFRQTGKTHVEPWLMSIILEVRDTHTISKNSAAAPNLQLQFTWQGVSTETSRGDSDFSRFLLQKLYRTLHVLQMN